MTKKRAVGKVMDGILDAIRGDTFAGAKQAVSPLAEPFGLQERDAADGRRGTLEYAGLLRGHDCRFVFYEYGSWEFRVFVDVPVLRQLHGVGLCPALTGRGQEDYHLGAAALPGHEDFDGRCAITASSRCSGEQLQATARKVPRPLLQFYCDCLDECCTPYLDSSLLRLSAREEICEANATRLWRYAEEIIAAGESAGFVFPAGRG